MLVDRSELPPGVLRERSIFDGAPGFDHQRVVVVQVVHREEPRPESLAALEEVLQVGSAERSTRRAGASRVERSVRIRVRGARHLHPPRRRERRALPRVARGEDAVEHVHPGEDRQEQIRRRPHSHQVPRPVGGEELGRELRDVLALRPTVAHGEAMLPQVRNRWMVGARLPAHALTNPLPIKLEERLTALEPGYQRLIVGFEILCIEIESSRIVDVMRNSAQIDTAETAHLLLEGGPTPAVAC